MSHGQGDSSGDDVIKVLTRIMREKLFSNNTLTEMAVKLRQEIHHLIYNRVVDKKEASQCQCKGPTALLNKLIQEYFEWMCFRYTSEMFKTESGNKPSSRQKLEAKLQNFGNFDEKFPILLDIVMKYMGEEKEEASSSDDENENSATENVLSCENETLSSQVEDQVEDEQTDVGEEEYEEIDDDYETEIGESNHQLFERDYYDRNYGDISIEDFKNNNLQWLENSDESN